MCGRRIVVVGAQGYTHHAVEDVGSMRMLPNMTVLCPGGSGRGRMGYAGTELATADPPACGWARPASRSCIGHLPRANSALGKAIRLKDGDVVTLISHGNMLETAIQSLRPILSREANFGWRRQYAHG